MKHRSIITGLLAIFCGAATLFSAAPAVAPFHKNETVSMLGDSITHGGHYVTILQLFWALRNPTEKVRILNDGISGNSAFSALLRYDWDVLPQKQDRVFVLFGMNDVGRGLYKWHSPSQDVIQRRKKALLHYAGNLEKLVDKLLSDGKQVVLVTPSPYDQYGELKTENLKSCNEPGLANCTKIVKQLAKAKNLPVVDLHTPMTDMIKKFRDKHLCGKDRVHPGPVGHLVMASLILKAMNLSPYPAQVAIDASTGKASLQNADVKELKANGNSVSFVYKPAALPYPVDSATYKAADRYLPFTEELNREELKITGLGKGKYTVKANGKKIGSFTEEELAQGVNLALLKTPSALQAKNARKAAEKLHEVVSKLRNIAFGHQWVKSMNGDISNAEAAMEAVSKWIEKNKGSSAIQYYQSVANAFYKNRPYLNEIQQNYNRCFKELYQSVQPQAYKLEIVGK